jgi:hypothetical protein
MLSLWASSREGVDRILLVTAAVIGMACSATGSQAADLPTLRQGLWEYRIVIESGSGPAQILTTKKCTSPMQELEKQNRVLAKSGCKISRIVRKDNTYTFTTNCSSNGPHSKAKAAITVEGDDRYTMEAETEQNGLNSKHSLVGRRIANCES